MKIISLDKCIKILQECAAIVIDDSCVTFPSLWLENLSDDNCEFLHITWTREREQWSTKFSIKHNKKITVSGTCLFLVDIEGDEIQITPLFTKELE